MEVPLIAPAMTLTTNTTRMATPGAGMKAALVLGLAALAAGVVGAGEAYADHCPTISIDCAHEKLRVDADVVNATLYPAQNGSVLEIWLNVTKSSSPHDHISFQYIQTRNGDALSEYCVEYPTNRAIELKKKTTYFKTCFFVPDWMSTDDLNRLKFGYILTTSGGVHGGFSSTKTSYDNTVSLRDITFVKIEREAEAEPMMCEAPATTTATVTPGPTDIESPQLMTVAYHKVFGELVLSFDETVTLVDGWQDNILIGDTSLGESANNRMVGESSLVWVSVDFTAKNELKDSASYVVTIEADTFLDADGNPNDEITMQAAITG